MKTNRVTHYWAFKDNVLLNKREFVPEQGYRFNMEFCDGFKLDDAHKLIRDWNNNKFGYSYSVIISR